jgi:hypothetical protein
MDWDCIVLDYVKHTSHKVRVRLYCPGYQTVEIRAHEDRDPIQWTAAPNLVAQEKAVDDLFATSNDAWAEIRVKDKGDRQLAGLEPGSTSVAHKKALLFAASEYERLAGTVLDDRDEGNTIRLRLLDKAGRFRKRASE